MSTGGQAGADGLGILPRPASLGCVESRQFKKAMHEMFLFVRPRRMLPQDQSPSPAPAFSADLARSRRLFAAFRRSRAIPTTSTERWPGTRPTWSASGPTWPGRRSSTSAVVRDISAMPSRRPGALYAGVEPDAGELSAHGEPGGIGVRGLGLSLLFADGCADVAFQQCARARARPAGDGRGDAGGSPAPADWSSWTPRLSRTAATRPGCGIPRRSVCRRPACCAPRQAPEERLRVEPVQLPGRADGALARATAADGRATVVDIFPRYHPAGRTWWPPCPDCVRWCRGTQ